jgi:hypothetical protein
MSPSPRRSVDDDDDDDDDSDDGSKKCTRCIRGPSYKHGHDITCPRSQKYVVGCDNNNSSSNSNSSNTTVNNNNNNNNNNDQKKQPANNTKTIKSSELDPELKEINRCAKAILTKAINTKSTELELELEEQKQQRKRKKTTTNTTRITTVTTKTVVTRRVDDGTKECTRCVRGPKYKHGHDITCPRSQNYVEI